MRGLRCLLETTHERFGLLGPSAELVDESANDMIKNAAQSL